MIKQHLRNRPRDADNLRKGDAVQCSCGGILTLDQLINDQGSYRMQSSSSGECDVTDYDCPNCGETLAQDVV